MKQQEVNQNFHIRDFIVYKMVSRAN